MDDRPKSVTDYQWTVVGMLWCITFFNYADRQAIFSVFPLLQKEMNLTLVQQGTLGSAFAWLYGLGAPLAGIVVDRIRRKSAILGGLYVWSAICMATAWSRTFGQLLFFRAAEGCGETIYYPATVSLISDYHGKETRSRALGFLQTSVYVGTIGGGFFAGLIGQNYGWRWSFVVFGGLGILLGFVLQRFLLEPKRGATDDRPVGVAASTLTPAQTIRYILRTPSAVLLMASFICANFVASVLLSWMPSFLHDRFHMSLAMAGLNSTIFAQLFGISGAVTGGWLADAAVKRTRRGRIIVQAVGVLAGAPFVVLCGMTQSVTWLLVALAGWGFFKGLYDANIFASPFDVIRPDARGTMAGMLNCVGWLFGGGSAPIIVGVIAERTSLGFAIATTSVVYCVAGLLLVICAVFFVERDSKGLPASQLAP